LDQVRRILDEILSQAEAMGNTEVLQQLADLMEEVMQNARSAEKRVERDNSARRPSRYRRR
jgi:gamma-glutamyl:cysteine ligase YbdK (ATP-grasp superfamily)